MLNIEVPLNVGEKIFYYAVFNNKLFVMNASVAEVETVTGKNGTSWIVRTNNGRTFFGNGLNVMFFLDEETAKAEAEKRIADVNESNRKIGKESKITFGGVI